MDDIASLKQTPERCSVGPESEDLEGEVRVLLHGRRNRTYKVYFSVHHESPATGVVSVSTFATGAGSRSMLTNWKI